MRTAWIYLLAGLLVLLDVGCNSLPECPEGFYDPENFRVRYVHDDEDGEFYLIEFYIEIENITEMLTELAVDAINPFAEVEVGKLLVLAASAGLDANLDITPCGGG